MKDYKGNDSVKVSRTPVEIQHVQAADLVRQNSERLLIGMYLGMEQQNDTPSTPVDIVARNKICLPRYQRNADDLILRLLKFTSQECIIIIIITGITHVKPQPTIILQLRQHAEDIDLALGPKIADPNVPSHVEDQDRVNGKENVNLRDGPLEWKNQLTESAIEEIAIEIVIDPTVATETELDVKEHVPAQKDAKGHALESVHVPEVATEAIAIDVKIKYALYIKDVIFSLAGCRL